MTIYLATQIFVWAVLAVLGFVIAVKEPTQEPALWVWILTCILQVAWAGTKLAG